MRYLFLSFNFLIWGAMLLGLGLALNKEALIIASAICGCCGLITFGLASKSTVVKALTRNNHNAHKPAKLVR